MNSNIFEVPVNDIEIGDLNVRKSSVESNIEELAKSIEIFGLLQPIVLKGTYGHPPYEVVVGQRRFLAHQYLGKETIKSTFLDNIDDLNAKILSLSENMHRLQLNYFDAANAITELYIDFGRDDNKVKEATGLHIRTIRNYIKVVEQATELGKKLYKEGKISSQDLRRVIDASQGDKDKADKLIIEITKLTKYEKDRAVKFGINNPNASVEEIIEDAKKPRAEETVILNLSMKVTKAIRKASEELSLDLESLTYNVLLEWLKSNNYLINE
jgi:ParB family transcriptional regulator, chromosome partitioning protein